MELLVCKVCEEFESEQNVIRNRGRQAFLDRDFALFDELDVEECRVIGGLKDHQLFEHIRNLAYEGQLPQS